MAELSKEKKKALMKKWKTAQKKKYMLNKTQVKKLISFLETKLEEEPCNHTMRYTEKWIRENCDSGKVEAVITEINEMGGYCDCEVLMNCYERYDIG